MAVDWLSAVWMGRWMRIGWVIMAWIWPARWDSSWGGSAVVEPEFGGLLEHQDQ